MMTRTLNVLLFRRILWDESVIMWRDPPFLVPDTRRELLVATSCSERCVSTSAARRRSVPDNYSQGKHSHTRVHGLIFVGIILPV